MWQFRDGSLRINGKINWAGGPVLKKNSIAGPDLDSCADASHYQAGLLIDLLHFHQLSIKSIHTDQLIMGTPLDDLPFL